MSCRMKMKQVHLQNAKKCLYRSKSCQNIERVPRLINKYRNILEQRPACLRMPTELLTIIYQFLFEEKGKEDRTLDLSVSGRGMVQNKALQTFQNDRMSCANVFRRPTDTNLIFPLVTFRAKYAASLSTWLERRPAPLREMIQMLEIKEVRAWNARDQYHISGSQPSPVNRRPPGWFNILYMSLIPALLNLKKLHVWAHFETGFFMAWSSRRGAGFFFKRRRLRVTTGLRN
jgi:hypothetical protein